MRPTQRPDQPYTREQFLRGAHQHFVVEGNPRCVNEDGQCLYGKTGCAVGWGFTAEDAETLDKGAGVRIWAVMREYPDIYFAYFDDSDETLDMLRRLQSVHDDCRDTSDLIAQLRIEFEGAGLEWPGGGE